MRKNNILLTDLLEVLTTGSDPLPSTSNPAVMVYEFNDRTDKYEDIDWEYCEEVLFSLGTSHYSSYAYLLPEYAYAIVERIWAIPGEPIRVMIRIQKQKQDDNP